MLLFLLSKPLLKGATQQDFPLYLHGSGQWTKTIKGCKWYFGTDKDAALLKYLDEKDAIKVGRNPRARSYLIRNGQGLPIEALQSIQALATAQREFIRAVSEYKVAQFTLQRSVGWPISDPQRGGYCPPWNHRKRLQGVLRSSPTSLNEN